MRKAKNNDSIEKENEIIKALEALGFVHVEDHGYTDHYDDAERILFFHPGIKKGLEVCISPPDDQQVFDEYYMQEVDEKFGTKILRKG